MALSKRARSALEVLRSEAEGNREAASALASVQRALGGDGEGQAEQATPGRRVAERVSSERQSSDDGSSTERGRPEPTQDAVPTDRATAQSSLSDLLRRRKKGAAQREKK